MFRGGFYPGDLLIGSAISAIDIALWDIKGQFLGVPVYELLGGRCRDYVQCFHNVNYVPAGGSPVSGELDQAVFNGDADAAVEMAKLCLANGHKYFRLNPPPQGTLFDSRKVVRRLLAQLRSVRAAIGDQLELMVDLHTRLDPSEAVWFCREAEPLQMFVVEDPIRSENWTGYRHLRSRTGTPLAAGEQWASKWEFRPAIDEDLIDYVRMDVCIAGGLSEAKKIAGWAETHYIRILPHNPMGPVCTAASLHLDLACSNAGPQEVLFPPKAFLPEVFECAFELKGTRLTTPSAPGISVTVNREAAKAYPTELGDPPQYHRPDGSYTNY